jgi:pyruvate/2-oxoglutarate dehydrogenase complex dihydrolipoamide acyltransferase (E2) component
MKTEVLLPKIGFSMNEGVLARWLVDDGGQVTAGQPLYELESEKSTQEVEAPASGRLRIIAAIGETYPVGTVLAEISD